MGEDTHALAVDRAPSPTSGFEAQVARRGDREPDLRLHGVLGRAPGNRPLVSECSLTYPVRRGTTAVRRERAGPMSPEERRDELVDVTLSLLREHGRAVTTRQIAEAAGVAEGTIFRVVESKEELVELAITRAFEPGRPGGPDRGDRPRPAAATPGWCVLTSILQQRFRATFELMKKVGMVRPPTTCTTAPRRSRCASALHSPARGRRRRRRRTGSRCRPATSCTGCGCSPSPAATRTSPTARCSPPRRSSTPSCTGCSADEGRERLMLLRLLRTHLAPYKPWLAAIVVLQFTATVAMLYLPSLNADIIDQGVAVGDTDYILHTGAVMLGGLAAPDRLLGGRGRLRGAHRRCRSAATCGRRSSTGSARSPAARSRSSARPR